MTLSPSDPTKRCMSADFPVPFLPRTKMVPPSATDTLMDESGPGMVNVAS